METLREVNGFDKSRRKTRMLLQKVNQLTKGTDKLFDKFLFTVFKEEI